jgi:hypothetical protein
VSRSVSRNQTQCARKIATAESSRTSRSSADNAASSGKWYPPVSTCCSSSKPRPFGLRRASRTIEAARLFSSTGASRIRGSPREVRSCAT